MLLSKENALSFVFTKKFLLHKHFKCCKKLLKMTSYQKQQHLIGIERLKTIGESIVDDL